MKTSTQIPLDLGFRVAQGREDFFVAPSNLDAVSWIDRWPDWPAPVLVLEGPPGCGKTHLARVWAARTGAACQDKEGQSAETLSAGGTHLVIDPMDPWIGAIESETILFHLYNILKESGRTALVTMQTPPAAAPFVLPDLASRLRAAPLASIRAPDDTLLAAILVKLFSDRQIKVGQDVLAYILPRMERSFEAAHALAHAADRASLVQKRPVSVPLIREILASTSGNQADESAEDISTEDTAAG
ncbi:MAG: DNA replication protein [Rhodospirillales bacterium]|nr:DNA replication protein [Rhodospirillales bacterium]